MKHNAHIHMKNRITELRGYGIYQGPGGEALEELDYYDIRSTVVKAQMQRNLEVKSSPWFP
ncbi:hypothetical protein [Planococcus rifietoensis]|uniref:hypothetical protein n=1 Tax=Planococcus rifietoensis TaxID=200991 RepID=UPI00384AF433